MERTIELHAQEIKYTLKVSARTRRMRLAVYHDGRTVVTVPKLLSQATLERFLNAKARWLIDKIAKFKSINVYPWDLHTKRDYLKHKKQAQLFAEERALYWNRIYGYSYNKITVRNQKTRWGSCSKNGNLNFNYKIALLPPALADYVIVHELCHLGEFNHSKNFWNLVARAIPEYKIIRREMKNMHC